MEPTTLPFILAILGSSVITALITTLGRRRTDQAVINNTLLENARKDISQIRIENLRLRARLNEMDKRITSLKTDIEERELLIRIAEKENQQLKEKVDCLEKELGIKNEQMKGMEKRIKELEKALQEMKGPS